MSRIHVHFELLWHKLRFHWLLHTPACEYTASSRQCRTRIENGLYACSLWSIGTNWLEPPVWVVTVHPQQTVILLRQIRSGRSGSERENVIKHEHKHWHMIRTRSVHMDVVVSFPKENLFFPLELIVRVLCLLREAASCVEMTTAYDVDALMLIIVEASRAAGPNWEPFCNLRGARTCMETE